MLRTFIITFTMCGLLESTSMLYAMDPTSPTLPHQDSNGQRLRRDTNHAIAPKEQRRMDVVKPFTKKEFAQYAWSVPAQVHTFNGYWPVWELEKDQTTQRLAASPQGIKEYVFDLVLSQEKVPGDTAMLQKYRIACCIAAGARGKMHTVLEQAIAQDDSTFVATLAPYEPDPNYVSSRMYADVTHEPSGVTTTETLQNAPLFFGVQSKKMAKCLWTRGADYTKRGHKDTGTVLHHVCSYPPPNPSQAVKLLKFYIDKGANVHALDNNERTALHCAVLNRSAHAEDFVLPFVLMLLQRGADQLKKDRHGCTFRDYLERQKFQPNPVGLTSHIVLAYVDPQITKRPDEYLPREYADTYCQDHVDLDEIATKVTPRFLKRNCLPLVPAHCADMSCKALTTNPEYSKAIRLLRCKRDVKSTEEAKALLIQEINRLLLDWQLARQWVALNVAIRLGDLFDSTDFAYIIQHAFLEDDCAFIQHLLRHKVPYFKHHALFVRSDTMFNMLKAYEMDAVFLQTSKDSLYTFFVRHGALLSRSLLDYYSGAKWTFSLEQRVALFESLAEYSYRFEGREAQLIALAYVLWGSDGIDIRCENSKTDKSILDVANATHKLWNLSITQQFIWTLISWHMARTYNKHNSDIVNFLE